MVVTVINFDGCVFVVLECGPVDAGGEAVALLEVPVHPAHRVEGVSGLDQGVVTAAVPVVERAIEGPEVRVVVRNTVTT